MHKIFSNFSAIIFIILFSSYSNLAVALTANKIVLETTQEVIDRLEKDKTRLKKEPEYIQVIVSELIIPHMDFNNMSKLSLGKKWETLTKEEKGCFTQGFRNLLIERYAFVLLSYRNQDISYQPVKPIGEKGVLNVVQTLTRKNFKPITIEYRMLPKNESWKVVDLVIDGISLIRNYRIMFNKKIKHNGLKNFIYSFEKCK